MSVFRRYSQAGGAIHDLEYIAGLSSERTIPLLLSPRVSYVLTNLVNQDLGFECRWAVERQEGGYLRLTTDDTEYPLFVDVLSAAGYEIRERQAGMGTLLNYREELFVQVSTDNASAGLNTLAIGPAPDGEVWVIEAIAAVNINTNPTNLNLYVGPSGSDVEIKAAVSPGAATWVTYQGAHHIGESQYVIARFANCAAGDDLYLRVTGYIMDLVT